MSAGVPGILTLRAPMSLTIRAQRRPWSLDLRILLRRVVLPDPRKPESRVTGSRLSLVSAGTGILLE